MMDQCFKISQYFNGPLSDPQRRIYIIVHAIDSHSLRSPEAQHALSVLARAKNLHLVTSFDHVNTPALWTAQHLEYFNWQEHNVPTYEAYTLEMPLTLPLKGMAQERSSGGVADIVKVNYYRTVILFVIKDLYRLLPIIKSLYYA